MLSIASASLSFAGAPAVRAPTAQPAVRMETKADLEVGPCASNAAPSSAHMLAGPALPMNVRMHEQSY